MSDDLKTAAARVALDEIREGSVIGIGTGSTAEAFVRLLAERVESGLLVTGVATSERTETLCRKLGIPMTDLDRRPRLSLVVDGADEFDDHLNLIKGGGGALLREKIVAAASDRMVVIADASKRVEQLGRFPLPIEVNMFGLEPTRLAVSAICRDHGMTGEMTLRHAEDGSPFETDGGHAILDAAMSAIPDVEALSRDLLDIPGVVEHGLFVGLADVVLMAGPNGVTRFERPAAQ